MGGLRSTNGEKRTSYTLLVEKTEGRRPVGRSRRRLMDNIKMDLGVIAWRDVDCVGLTQDMGQVESSCECSNEPSVSRNSSTNIE
jgi:hypothetical protein